MGKGRGGFSKNAFLPAFGDIKVDSGLMVYTGFGVLWIGMA